MVERQTGESATMNILDHKTVRDYQFEGWVLADGREVWQRVYIIEGTTFTEPPATLYLMRALNCTREEAIQYLESLPFVSDT